MGERPLWVGETPVGGRGPRGWARPLVGRRGPSWVGVAGAAGGLGEWRGEAGPGRERRGADPRVHPARWSSGVLGCLYAAL